VILTAAIIGKLARPRTGTRPAERGDRPANLADTAWRIPELISCSSAAIIWHGAHLLVGGWFSINDIVLLAWAARNGMAGPVPHIYHGKWDRLGVTELIEHVPLSVGEY